jgi:hypothetical protein
MEKYVTLGTSDWVTIIATALSIICSAVISIGIAIWQVRKTLNPQPTPSKTDRVFPSSVRAWLLAQVWPFIVSGVLAVFIITQALLSDGAVTRSFVISLVFGSLLLAFSVLSSLGFLVAAAFRPAYLKLEKFSLPRAARAPSSET